MMDRVILSRTAVRLQATFRKQAGVNTESKIKRKLDVCFPEENNTGLPLVPFQQHSLL